MTRAVLDTNVVVSAVLFSGRLARIAHEWQRGGFTFLVSSRIIREYLQVVAYPKFQLAPHEIRKIIYAEILPYVEGVRVRSTFDIIKKDPSDNMFLECAWAGRADYIVSGDEHLLALRAFRKVRIISPEAFLSLL